MTVILLPQTDRKYSHTNSYNFAMTTITQDDHYTAGAWAACDLPSIQPARRRRKTDDSTLCSSTGNYTKSRIKDLCSTVQYNISYPGFSFVLLSPLCCGSALIFRVLQADLYSLRSISILGIIYGAAEVIERSSMVAFDHNFCIIWKRKSAPWGSFRTPRRERLVPDIAIMGMLHEATTFVSVCQWMLIFVSIYIFTKQAFLTSIQTLCSSFVSFITY